MISTLRLGVLHHNYLLGAEKEKKSLMEKRLPTFAYYYF